MPSKQLPDTPPPQALRHPLPPPRACQAPPPPPGPPQSPVVSRWLVVWVVLHHLLNQPVALLNNLLTSPGTAQHSTSQPQHQSQHIRAMHSPKHLPTTRHHSTADLCPSTPTHPAIPGVDLHPPHCLSSAPQCPVLLSRASSYASPQPLPTHRAHSFPRPRPYSVVFPSGLRVVKQFTCSSWNIATGLGTPRANKPGSWCLFPSPDLACVEADAV